MSSESFEFPIHGRLAGIDFGTVRIGISVCDGERILASPHENYSRQSIDEDAEHFRQLVRSESIVGFVVGLPVHSSGDESEKSKEARAFASWLTATTGLPIAFYDERYVRPSGTDTIRRKVFEETKKTAARHARRPDHSRRIHRYAPTCRLHARYT